uniref:Uncharacterized protein n=1 Tax=Tetradesmus obliquus TaxID=3088 RepID=A0A383WGD9_TETOB|eukprot:jgi/Sobl393_1/9483/SZX76501.1
MAVEAHQQGDLVGPLPAPRSMQLPVSCVPPPPPPPSSPPTRFPPQPPAVPSLQQPQQAAAAARIASSHGQPTDTDLHNADQGGATAAAARLLAGQAGSRSQAPDCTSAAFKALAPATQQLIQEACGSIPPDQQLAAWQVAVQPFDPRQLQALCASYMRCNFAGVSWEPEVRSKELVPLLQQLHTEAKAEQQGGVATGATAGAAAAVTIQPTPVAVKLLRALRLLQHWDIVCPTQPGMPEPLRKMMQQAGCAAAGSASDEEDDGDDVQMVDAAAEVDDDVDAQLQQLEDGECELVLVKYVPGPHEQPDVQLVDQAAAGAPAPVLQQQHPAVPPAAPAQPPGQQQGAGQPAVQPMVQEELPLKMRTRAAKRSRRT